MMASAYTYEVDGGLNRLQIHFAGSPAQYGSAAPLSGCTVASRMLMTFADVVVVR